MFPWLYPNIEAERAKRNWSKTYLADTLNVSRTTYISWVTKGNIPSEKIKQMSNLFDCSMEYLLGNGIVNKAS